MAYQSYSMDENSLLIVLCYQSPFEAIVTTNFFRPDLLSHKTFWEAVCKRYDPFPKEIPEYIDNSHRLFFSSDIICELAEKKCPHAMKFIFQNSSLKILRHFVAECRDYPEIILPLVFTKIREVSDLGDVLISKEIIREILHEDNILLTRLCIESFIQEAKIVPQTRLVSIIYNYISSFCRRVGKNTRGYLLDLAHDHPSLNLPYEDMVNEAIHRICSFEDLPELMKVLSRLPENKISTEGCISCAAENDNPDILKYLLSSYHQYNNTTRKYHTVRDAINKTIKYGCFQAFQVLFQDPAWEEDLPKFWLVETISDAMEYNRIEIFQVLIKHPLAYSGIIKDLLGYENSKFTDLLRERYQELRAVEKPFLT